MAEPLSHEFTGMNRLALPLPVIAVKMSHCGLKAHPVQSSYPCIHRVVAAFRGSRRLWLFSAVSLLGAVARRRSPAAGLQRL
jgi:hypothetical protein